MNITREILIRRAQEAAAAYHELSDQAERASGKKKLNLLVRAEHAAGQNDAYNALAALAEAVAS